MKQKELYKEIIKNISGPISKAIEEAYGFDCPGSYKPSEEDYNYIAMEIKLAVEKGEIEGVVERELDSEWLSYSVDWLYHKDTDYIEITGASAWWADRDGDEDECDCDIFEEDLNKIFQMINVNPTINESLTVTPWARGLASKLHEISMQMDTAAAINSGLSSSERAELLRRIKSVLDYMEEIAK